VLIFLLSLLVLPFCTGGDQSVYRKIYAGLPDFSLTQGFSFYSQNILSREFVHYFLSWVASRLIGKDLFISFSNAILAYVTMSLFLKWKASITIAFMLLLTNFYFLVLYFAAERLKFGFIFLVLSMIYIDRFKQFYVLAVLALVSHASVLIVYVSTLFKVFVGQISKLFRTGKVSKLSLLVIPFLIIPLLLVKSQIISKFLIYYTGGKLLDLGRISVFLLLALLYSKKRSETIILFIPIVIAAFLLGGFRVNMFGYFLFLYYGLQFRGGWNFGVLATSVYFAYSSTILLINIIQHGDGSFPGLEISLIGALLP